MLESTDTTAMPPPQVDPNDSVTKTDFPECEKAVTYSTETAVELSLVPLDLKISSAQEKANSSASGRERLKRHRVDVAGRVWIPDMWGQEGFLKDWVDSSVFDASLVNVSIPSARDSLVEQARRAVRSTRLKLETT